MTTMVKIKNDEQIWPFFKEDNMLQTLFKKIESMSNLTNIDYEIELPSKISKYSKLNLRIKFF